MDDGGQTGKIARWAIMLQEYDFEVKYRKGKDNVPPDTLPDLIRLT